MSDVEAQIHELKEDIQSLRNEILCLFKNGPISNLQTRVAIVETRTRLLWGGIGAVLIAILGLYLTK